MTNQEAVAEIDRLRTIVGKLEADLVFWKTERDRAVNHAMEFGPKLAQAIATAERAKPTLREYPPSKQRLDPKQGALL